MKRAFRLWQFSPRLRPHHAFAFILPFFPAVLYLMREQNECHRMIFLSFQYSTLERPESALP